MCYFDRFKDDQIQICPDTVVCLKVGLPRLSIKVLFESSHQ